MTRKVLCDALRWRVSFSKGKTFFFKGLEDKRMRLFYWACLNRGVSKQGVMTFVWRPGSQYDVTAVRGADNVLASDCRAQFGRPSTRRGCRICVTVRLPVRPRGETIHWQAMRIPPFPLPPFKCALFYLQLRSFCLRFIFLTYAGTVSREAQQTKPNLNRK